MTREALLRCEDGFTACFAQREEQADWIRFRDASLPDMYDHNYLILRRPMDDRATRAYIEAEIARCRAEGREYCEVRLDAPPSKALLGKLPLSPEVTRLGLYYAEEAGALSLRPHPDLTVMRVSTPEGLQTRKDLETAIYADEQGDDFLRRKHERRGPGYLSPQGVETYLGFVGGQAVAKCDLYLQDGIAMLEDFDVLPEHQRKGYGTAMIHALVGQAVSRGARSVLMVADEAETAKEMYKKLGFSSVPGRTILFFDLHQPLPKGYRLDRTIDLMKDPRSLRAVSLLSLALMVVFLALGAVWVPLSLDRAQEFAYAVLAPFSVDFAARYAPGPVGVALAFALLFAMSFLYLIGHEAVHGLCMTAFSRIKPHFGFKGMYAYAASPAFFVKNQYITIALAPVVLFGALFLALNLTLPVAWFWPVYWLQVFNLSGAAGDLYVTGLLARAPSDTLVQDDGARMRIYAKKPEPGSLDL